MKIFIGADHRGFELKEKIKVWLDKNNISYEDVGAHTFNENDDYVDYARKAAEKVASNSDSKGILVCGSGVGMDIVANKIKGTRCGFGFDGNQIKMAREDDDINLLALPADFLDKERALKIIEEFFNTGFKNEEKYKRRIEKIKDIENGI